MKYFAFIFAFAAFATAQAHIEPGTFTGVTDDGKVCTMIAGKTTFENGLRHPLTERFDLTVDGVQFSAGHPSAADVQNSAVTFNHDLVQGINANKEGAVALVVTMVHTEEFEGPSEFTFIDHNWIKKTKTAKHCQKLVHSK